MIKGWPGIEYHGITFFYAESGASLENIREMLDSGLALVSKEKWFEIEKKYFEELDELDNHIV